MSVSTAGFSGKGVRSDCQIALADSLTGSTILEVQSSVQAMYGEAIRTQILSLLEQFQAPPLKVTVQDSGALPFVIAARLEAALAMHLEGRLPALGLSFVRSERAKRSRRSRLYVPGSTPKLLPSIGLYGADSIILDLEDSVSPDQKLPALALVRRALTAVDFGRSEKLVRVNSGSQGLKEIEELLLACPDGFVLPKVESAEDVLAAASALDGQDGRSVLIPIIESARGLHFAYEIASCHPSVAALALGIEDYLADTGAAKTERGGMVEFAVCSLVNSCRAAGVSPLGPIFSQVDDEEGMKAFAARMADLGCDGVGCLHPRQIEPVHLGMRPGDAALTQASAIIEAFSQVQGNGEGVVSLNGRMIDPPVTAQARRVLERGGISL